MATTVATLEVIIAGNTRGLSRSLRDAENSISGFSRSVSNRMSSFGRAYTTAVTVPILATGALAARTAMQWESAFAGVEKTVTASEETLAMLNRELRDLATNSDAPVAGLANAHTELAKIAELGGQLGVAPEEIANFTEVIGELTIATDLTGEAAATMLAQYANITGMDFSRMRSLGNVIVGLGNSTATTESQIVSFMHRMAGAASIVGFTDDEIAAMAASAASVGLRAESAGTSMTKLLLEIDEAVAGFSGGMISADSLIARYGGQMEGLMNEQFILTNKVAEAQERFNEVQGTPAQGRALEQLQRWQTELAEVNSEIQGTQRTIEGFTPGTMVEWSQSTDALNLFAEISGRTAADFAELWGSDASTALVDFLTGFGKLDSGDQIKALQDLELSGIRVSDMIRRMSGDTSILTDALELAGVEWRVLNGFGQGALEVEAGKRFNTTAAQVNLLKNNLYDLGITIGNVLLPPINLVVGVLSEIIAGFARMSPEVANTVVLFAALVAAIGPVFWIGGKVAGVFAIITGSTILSGILAIAGAFTAVVAALGWISKESSLAEGLLQRIGTMFGRSFGSIVRIGKAVGSVIADIFTIFTQQDTSTGGRGFIGIIEDGLRRLYSLSNNAAKALAIIATVSEYFAAIFMASNSEMYELRGTIMDAFDDISGSKVFQWLFGEGATGETALAKLEGFADKVAAKFIGLRSSIEEFYNKVKEKFDLLISMTPQEIFSKISEEVKKLQEVDWDALFGDIVQEVEIGAAAAAGIAVSFVNSVASALVSVSTQPISDSIKSLLGIAIAGRGVSGPVEQGDSGFQSSAGEQLVSSIIDGIEMAFINASQAIKETFTEYSTKIRDWFVEKWNAVDWTSIQTDIESKLSAIRDSITGFFDRIGQVADKTDKSEGTLGFLRNFISEFTSLDLPEGESPEATIFDGVIKQLIAIVGSVTAFYNSGNGDIIRGARTLLTPLISFLEKLGVAKGVLSKIAGGLTGFVGINVILELVNRLPELFASVREMFANAAEGNWAGVVKLISGIGAVIGIIGDVIGRVGGDLIIGVLPQLGKFVAGVADFLGSIADYFTDSDVSAGEVVGNAIGMLGDGILVVIDALSTLFASIASLIVGEDRIDATAISEGLTNIFSSIFEGITEGLTTALQMVELSFLQIFNEILGILDGLGVGVDGLRTAIQEKINGILTDLGQPIETTLTEPFRVNVHTNGIALELAPGDITPEGTIFTGNTRLDEAIQRNINDAILALSSEDRAGYVASLQSIGLDISALTLTEEAKALIPNLVQGQTQSALAAAEAPMSLLADTYINPVQPQIEETTATMGTQLQSQLTAQSPYVLAADAVLNVNITDVNMSGMPMGMDASMLFAQSADGHQTGGMAAYTGLHYLHQGEEVLTRNEAQRYRAGMNGGGNNINIYGVQDVDALLSELERRGIYL